MFQLHVAKELGTNHLYVNNRTVLDIYYRMMSNEFRTAAHWLMQTSGEGVFGIIIGRCE